MYKSFNKLGSIEIEGNSLKYRIATQEIKTERPDEVQKEIKRILHSIENQNIFLLPFDIQTINRYMVMFYDLSSYRGFDYLRELTLKEKLPYFLSLIQIAKAEQKSINVLWDLMNFVVDRHDKTIKVMLFETEHLKVYEKKDSFKMVVDFMIWSMTTLNKIIALPKRNDFIDPSEENITFVETIFRLDNLDDLYMYIESLLIELETKEKEEEVQQSERKKLFKKGKGISLAKTKKKTPKKKPVRHYNHQQPKKKKQDKNTKMMKMGTIFVGVSMLIYFLLPVILPPGKEEVEKKPVVTEEQLKNTGDYFKDSKKYNDQLVTAYRKAYNSQYSDAFKILANVPKKELSSSDVSMIITVYNEANKLNKLLDEVPSLAPNVVSYLLADENSDQTEKLTEINNAMEVKNPYIEFEVFYSEGKYKEMLALKNKLEMNGRREQQIIDAYLALGKIADARAFANDSGDPNLIKQVDSYKN
jgi:hypothetical protein